MTEELTYSLGSRDFSAAATLKTLSLVLLVIAPFVFTSFFVDLLVQSLILAVFALGVDLLWGYSGILTFGHAAFFGFGAYITAKILLATSVGGISYLAVALAILIPGFLGLVLAGVLFYRGIDEEYFTIITLAVAIIAQQIAVSWQSVTNGFNGLTNVPSLQLWIPGVLSVPVEDYVLYYVALVVMLAVYLFGRRTVDSPFGTALVAIDQNETKARSLGYDTRRYKTLVFGLASALAGLAGAVYAGYGSFVSPPLLGFVFSTEVLIWVLVGGRGTLVGAIVGTVFISMFQNFLSSAFQYSWTLLLGIVLVVIVLFFPEGIIGLLELAATRIATRGDSDE